VIITERRCELCRFKNVEPDKSMTCRHDPPVAQTVVIVTPKGPQTLGVVASWPPVEGRQWCAKFEKGVIQ